MSAADPLQAYLDAQADFVTRVPAGCDSVERIRARGRDRFAQVGFPSTRDENWKYTNVRTIQDQVFVPADAGLDEVERSRLANAAIPGLNGIRAVYVNGQFAPHLAELDGLPQGAFVGGLAATLNAHPDRLDAVLGHCAPPDLHGFAALNGAFLHDGACIVLAPGAVAETPIELLFVTTAGPQPLLSQPRNVIVAGEGSQATIIERYVSLHEGVELTNTITELDAKPGAVVRHYKLQEQNPLAFHVGGLCIRQQRDSTVTNNNVALGGRLARTDITAVLEAPGAHCDLFGLYLASGRQHIDNFTHVDHAAPHCTSRELYKGVLDGHARAVFHGRVV
ncbi:MAG: SufD family Fe-S cluster assembly protein, partial [Gammaproteobacteria bacterium]|nr:SufD family Fe-S cluster assembly protein [Gammaproteobacteria bacterium]